jgi:hypothetical protein
LFVVENHCREPRRLEGLQKLLFGNMPRVVAFLLWNYDFLV